MSANVFESKIRARFDSPCFFFHDEGKHIASFPAEGIYIIGNMFSEIATVNWGSGHGAQFAL